MVIFAVSSDVAYILEGRSVSKPTPKGVIPSLARDSLSHLTLLDRMAFFAGRAAHVIVGCNRGLTVKTAPASSVRTRTSSRATHLDGVGFQYRLPCL